MNSPLSWGSWKRFQPPWMRSSFCLRTLDEIGMQHLTGASLDSQSVVQVCSLSTTFGRNLSVPEIKTRQVIKHVGFTMVSSTYNTNITKEPRPTMFSIPYNDQPGSRQGGQANLHGDDMGSAFVSQWCWQSLLGLRLAPLKVKALADSKLAVWQREDWTWLVGWVDFRIFSVKQTLQNVGSPLHSKRFGVGFIQDLGSILAFDNFDGAVEQDSKATAIWGMEIWRRLPNSRGISRICPTATGVSADRNCALY